MAGGGNFIHRVMSYVANELIVNGLANRLSLFTDSIFLNILASLEAFFYSYPRISLVVSTKLMRLPF